MDLQHTKPISPRAATVTGNGVITQDLSYTEQRMLDLVDAQVSNSKGENEIEEQIGDRCVEYFSAWNAPANGSSAPPSKVTDGDWNKCKAKVLGEYADRIGSDRTNFLLNKDVAASVLAPHAKSLGVPSSDKEAKLNPIMPPLLTFGQVSHIYEGMKPMEPTDAEKQAAEYNSNYIKYGIGYEGYVVTKPVYDDPENHNAGMHDQVQLDDHGNPQISPTYLEDVEKLKQAALSKADVSATPKPSELGPDGQPKDSAHQAAKPTPAERDAELKDRIRPSAKDTNARLSWLHHHNSKGNPNSSNGERIKAAYSYVGLDGKEHSTYEAHRHSFNRSRKALVDASNAALEKDVGHGGFAHSAAGRTGHRPHDKYAEIERNNQQRGPAFATQQSSDQEPDDNRRVTLPDGAQDQIGQFSIGYSDDGPNGTKKMLDDAVENVLTAP